MRFNSPHFPPERRARLLRAWESPQWPISFFLGCPSLYWHLRRAWELSLDLATSWCLQILKTCQVWAIRKCIMRYFNCLFAHSQAPNFLQSAFPIESDPLDYQKKFFCCCCRYKVWFEKSCRCLRLTLTATTVALFESAMLLTPQSRLVREFDHTSFFITK